MTISAPLSGSADMAAPFPGNNRRGLVAQGGGAP